MPGGKKLDISNAVSVLQAIGLDVSLVLKIDRAKKYHICYNWFDEDDLHWYLITEFKPVLKRYKVRGSRGSLRELISTVFHDVDCGCNSCIRWLISTIEDNTGPKQPLSAPGQLYLDYLKTLQKIARTQKSRG